MTTATLLSLWFGSSSQKRRTSYNNLLAFVDIKNHNNRLEQPQNGSSVSTNDNKQVLILETIWVVGYSLATL